MKNIFSTLACLAIIVAITSSCNQSSKTANGQPEKSDSLKANVKNDTAVKTNPIKLLVTDYLALKNALIADNSQAAANAGKQLLTALNGVDMATIPADKHKDYMDIADDAKENAEHIGANAEKIAHQREHFESLSKDVNDLIALFGAPQKLYQDRCPMYNAGKGAIWISETQEIKNPYYGKQMLTCGAVKAEY